MYYVIIKLWIMENHPILNHKKNSIQIVYISVAKRPRNQGKSVSCVLTENNDLNYASVNGAFVRR
jgi:hypothetical protein